MPAQAGPRRRAGSRDGRHGWCAYRVVLTLQVDSARGSPESWDWPNCLGLRPPERVVAEVTHAGEAHGDPDGSARATLVTRLSGDELRDGYVWNGFDYALQVWVVDGVVQRVRPPARDVPAHALLRRVRAGRPADRPDPGRAATKTRT